MEYIDKIFYINLERRKDRLDQIHVEFEKMDFPEEKIERFNAVDLGQIGCIDSHLGVLMLAKERHYKNVLILEDDFTFLVDRKTFDQKIRYFFSTKKPEFYVLMLSYLCFHSEPFDNQVSIGMDCQDASGYLVNESAYNPLITLFSYGRQELLKTGAHWLYVNDQIWKKMQTEGKWFIFNEPIGKQSGSESNLANTNISVVDGEILIHTC